MAVAMNWAEAEARASLEAPAAGKVSIRRIDEADWETAKRMYTLGVVVDGEFEWPTYAWIARKLGCSIGNVTSHAHRYGWPALRKKESQRLQRDRLNKEQRKAFDPDRKKSDLENKSDSAVVSHETVHAAAPPAPESSAPDQSNNPEDPLDVVERYIGDFSNKLKSGQVKLDSIADFREAVKLAQWLRTEQAHERESAAAMSLAELQARHAELRAREARITKATAGVLEQASEGEEALERDASSRPHPPGSTSTPRTAASVKNRRSTVDEPHERAHNDARPKAFSIEFAEEFDE